MQRGLAASRAGARRRLDPGARPRPRRGRVPGENGRIAFGVEKWRLPDPCLPEPHGCEPEVFSSSIETVLPSGRGRRVLRAFRRGRASASPAGLVAERQALDLPTGEPARDRSRRRQGVAATAAAHQRRRRPHLVARRPAARVRRPHRLLQLALLGAPRWDGPPPRPGAGGPLARLVDDRHDRVRQLQRPARQIRRPQDGPYRSDPTARGCAGSSAATGERASSPTGRPTAAGSPSSRAGTSSP